MVRGNNVGEAPPLFEQQRNTITNIISALEESPEQGYARIELYWNRWEISP